GRRVRRKREASAASYRGRGCPALRSTIGRRNCITCLQVTLLGPLHGRLGCLKPGADLLRLLPQSLDLCWVDVDRPAFDWFRQWPRVARPEDQVEIGLELLRQLDSPALTVESDLLSEPVLRVLQDSLQEAHQPLALGQLQDLGDLYVPRNVFEHCTAEGPAPNRPALVQRVGLEDAFPHRP